MYQSNFSPSANTNNGFNHQGLGPDSSYEVIDSAQSSNRNSSQYFESPVHPEIFQSPKIGMEEEDYVEIGFESTPVSYEHPELNDMEQTIQGPPPYKMMKLDNNIKETQSEKSKSNASQRARRLYGPCTDPSLLKEHLLNHVDDLKGGYIEQKGEDPLVYIALHSAKLLKEWDDFRPCFKVLIPWPKEIQTTSLKKLEEGFLNSYIKITKDSLLKEIADLKENEKNPPPSFSFESMPLDLSKLLERAPEKNKKIVGIELVKQDPYTVDIFHQVQAGESLWNLAEFYYGKGIKYGEIQKNNPKIINANKILCEDIYKIRWSPSYFH